jgi:hypothetical protein
MRKELKDDVKQILGLMNPLSRSGSTPICQGYLLRLPPGRPRQSTHDTLICCNIGVDVEYVLTGYRCVLQLVDVGLNVKFKRHIQGCDHKWCIEKLPAPNHEDIFTLVLEA